MSQCIIELSSLEVSVRQAGAPGCLIHTISTIVYQQLKVNKGNKKKRQIFIMLQEQKNCEAVA
jgi:hypothetical protein